MPIDNSAGVNTSDIEVNIKIALMPGDGATAGSPRVDLHRRRLLDQMTEDVAGADVCDNELLQTLALSLSQRRGSSFSDFDRNAGCRR